AVPVGAYENLVRAGRPVEEGDLCVVAVARVVVAEDPARLAVNDDQGRVFVALDLDRQAGLAGGQPDHVVGAVEDVARAQVPEPVVADLPGRVALAAGQAALDTRVVGGRGVVDVHHLGGSGRADHQGDDGEGEAAEVARRLGGGGLGGGADIGHLVLLVGLGGEFGGGGCVALASCGVVEHLSSSLGRRVLLGWKECRARIPNVARTSVSDASFAESRVAGQLECRMRLKTLGGLSVEGSAFTRPVPLLLLAYVRLRGNESRQHLGNVFFIDKADSGDSVSVALRQLEHGLGDEVIDRDWDSVASRIDCDLLELNEAYAKGDLEAVVSVYGGPFLENLEASRYVKSEDWSEELASWVHKERLKVASKVFAAGVRLGTARLSVGRRDEASRYADIALRAFFERFE